MSFWIPLKLQQGTFVYLAFLWFLVLKKSFFFLVYYKPSNFTRMATVLINVKYLFKYSSQAWLKKMKVVLLSLYTRLQSSFFFKDVKLMCNIADVLGHLFSEWFCNALN